MADRGDTHYSIRALNLWFLVSSAVMLVCVVWTMLDDHHRPWKDYQREFRALELERAQAEEQELEASGAVAREGELQSAVSAAQAQFDQSQAQVSQAEEALRRARGVTWKAVEDAKKAKSKFNWDRYLIEERRRVAGDPELEAEELAAVELEMNTLVTAQQAAEEAQALAQAKLDELRSGLEQARSKLAAGTRDLERVRGRIEQLAPSDPAAKVANVIRDAPGLDFIGPNLKVEKVVLQDLTFDLNFTRKKRIDMCHTCHRGIDRAGFEGEQQPFATHPRLDLYLTAKSPHPLGEFGCTICHRGSGEALDFVRADHRPETAAQQEEWHDEHGWHKQHHWDYPMLQKSMTEASCIQCHKTSMEVIAEDAPTVTRGYHLVERYGCYACHKIDWFPTKRRPGPTLTNLQAKVSPEWIASWIANPKDFRPTTWMPQFFHLENFAADEPVVASRYGQGREILGGEWEDASIDAVAAFLTSRAPLQELPAIPVEGDALRGREVMRVSGCYACHNVAPWDGEEPVVRDMAWVASGTNEHGPNLRGVATKVTPEWLYAWIKDPQAYWADTRMPNLRLSDQDAADITAYISEDPDGIFRDTPASWKPGRIEMDPAQEHEVLAEQARWFFSRLGRSAIESRLEGQDPENRWDDLETLKVAVGERVVNNYGCFSCHEISGMQDMMPIGTELSAWGSKEVAKLDFGFGASLFGLDPNYREPWLMQKLHAPRSFDREKVKNPVERLRMPWFNFTEEEVRSITTFVSGLVTDEVQLASMVPDDSEQVLDAGARAVRQNNCVACHQIEPGTVTYVDEDGREQTVQAELMGIGEEAVPPDHTLADVDRLLEREEVTEVGFRVLRAEPEAGLKVGDKVFVERENLRALGAPEGGHLVRLITDYYLYGQETFDPEAAEDDAYSYVTGDPDGEGRVQDVDGELRDYSSEPYDKVRWTFAPPVLWNEGDKVNKEWLYSFLRDVVPLRPQIRVRMPSFHFQGNEAQAVAGYFAERSRREWPARYARALRLSQGQTAEELAALGNALSPAAVRAIEDGSRPDIAASFAKLFAVGEAQGFRFPPAVDPRLEASTLRSAAYLARRSQEEPQHLKLGETLATTGVNCYQCHFRLGEPPSADPVAWAPDLARVHERLRESWVHEWLKDPGIVYPGTSMPANFAAETPLYQELYPDSTNADQIRAVLEWLYNFDRVYLGSLSQ
jgi:cbb3-type cytochrome oxidase cytochrome c subunit